MPPTFSLKGNARPYLSVVVVARNDDYGGHFVERMQLFLNNQAAFWETYGVHAELIIVEWNPPADRPRLKQVLDFPKPLRRGAVRLVEVPSRIHQMLHNAERMPLYEYIGKNVGARRAWGEYVLVANPDILLNEPLMEFLGRQELTKDAFYRINKYDVGGISLPPARRDFREVLAEYGAHIVLRHNRYGPGIRPNEHPLGLKNIHRVISYAKQVLAHYPYTPPYANAAGDFFLMSREHWETLRGYPEFRTHSLMDGYICYMAAALGLRQVVLGEPMRIYHFEHHHGGTDTRPWADTRPYRKRCLTMLKTQTPWIPNDANWGFGHIDLPEYRIA